MVEVRLRRKHVHVEREGCHANVAAMVMYLVGRLPWSQAVLREGRKRVPRETQFDGYLDTLKVISTSVAQNATVMLGR